MTTHCIRKMLGGNRGEWTQKEFAEHFNIPIGTVKNWDARDCMPEYIFFILKELWGWRENCIDAVKNNLDEWDDSLYSHYYDHYYDPKERI